MSRYRKPLLFLFAIIVGGPAQAVETLSLEIFGSRPKAIMEEPYQPLVDYLSTRLYPEWSFITLPHVDRRTLSRIASALLALEADPVAARAVGIAGLAPPADNMPVGKVAGALRLPSYDQEPVFSLRDVWEQHKTAMILLLLLFVSVCYLSWLFARRNRKLIRQEGVAKRYADRIQHIIDASQVGTWEWNVQTGKISYNDRWAEMLGYARGELLSDSTQTWIDLIHPDDAKTAQEILQQHFAGEIDFYEADFRMQHKAGHWLWIHDRGQVIEWAADGSPLCMIGTHTDITARKETELALKQSEERLDFALSVANEGIWDWNLGDNTVIFDSRYYTMAGYEADGFPGGFEEWEKRVHPDDIQQALLAVQQYLVGESEAFDVEFRFRRKNSDYMWIRGRGQIVAWDEKGDPARFVGTHSDINERKRTALALQESQSKYQHLLDNVGNKFVIYSYRELTDELDYVSDGFTSVFGIPKESVLGKSWSGQINWLPEDVATAQFNSDQQMEGKADFLQYDMRFIHPDGAERSVRVSSHPVTDESGNICSIDGILEDITEQKVAQEQLRLAASVFDYSQESIIITDANVRMVDVNPACLKVTGYSKEELLGKNPRIFSAGTHSAGFYRKMWESLSSGKLWRGTFNNLRKDGTPCQEEAAISPIKNSMGEITHYVSVKHDVTSQKAHEKALRHAKRAAQAANIAKSEFLANISHEIRTPMNAILGFTELCLEGDLAQEYRGYLTNVRDSSNTLLVLINDILDFSKIEAGKLELESIPFDLDEELAFVFSLMQENARKKHVELRLSQAYGDLIKLSGDPLRLKQVLINLTSNAIKFTDHGKVVISVNELERSDAFVRLEFSVSDTGVGLSVEEQKNLFLPFWQGDNSTTRKFEGTGLGLAISNGLVSGMGGTLEVESEEGKGSSFYFRVTFSLIGGKKKSPLEVETKQNMLEHISGARILLVEDNEINQQLVTTLLERQHMCVEIACNGQEAIDKLYSNQYDLVLMDIQMPVMDGYQATRKIRKDRRFDVLPIIALTANAMPGVQEECLQAGMNDYVTKPINILGLVNKIECLLEPAGQTTPIKSAKTSAMDWEAPSYLADIPGVDVKEAVHRLDIDVKSYAELLKKFAFNHRNDAKELEKLVVQKEWDDACRMAHTLKGLAGTAGMAELSRLSMRLQQALSNMSETQGSGESQKAEHVISGVQDELKHLLADTDEALRNITSCIDRFPITERVPPYQRKADIEEIRHQLKELLELSEECNVAAIGKLEALLLVVADASAKDKLKKIQLQLEDYDFDVAAKGLKTLLAHMEQ